MGDLKLDYVREAKPDVLVSGDMGCLMHLQGLADKEGLQLRSLHVAQVLRDSLAAKG
jgi:L-lactate dehydrogenase complex protein LldE